MMVMIMILIMEIYRVSIDDKIIYDKSIVDDDDDGDSISNNDNDNN